MKKLQDSTSKSIRGYSKRQTEKVADRNIKYCPSCRSCWESFKKRQIGNHYDFSYYKDFPSFGKDRAKCPWCYEKEGNSFFIHYAQGIKEEVPIERLHRKRIEHENF